MPALNITMENATTAILTVIDNAALQLHYKCRTGKVLFSIADFGGNVISRGGYDCVVDDRVSVAGLTPGIYTLCIIDGDQLIKVPFRIR